MFDPNNTYEGTEFQQTVTAVVGSDMHNGVERRVALLCDDS